MNKQNALNLIISYGGLSIAFFNGILKGRVLSTDEVGHIAYILSIASIVAVIASFSIPQIILKFYHQYSKQNFILELIKIQLIILGLVIIVFSVFAFLFKVDDIIIISSFIMINSLTTSFTSISKVDKKPVEGNFLTTLLQPLINLLLLIITGYYGWGIYEYIILFIIIRIVILIAIFLIVRNIFLPIFNLNKEDYKVFFHYGFFILLNGFSVTFINNIDKIMIANMINFSANGIYTIALAMGSIIGIIGRSYSWTVQNEISRLLTKSDFTGLKRLYRSNLDDQLYIGVFMFSMLIIFSKKLLGLVGEEYVSGSLVLILIALGMFVNIGTGACGGIISLSNYFKYELYINLVLLVLTVISNLIFIPIFNIEGAAFATSMSLIIFNIIKLIVVYKKFDMIPFQIINLKYFVLLGIISLLLHIILKRVEFTYILMIILNVGSFMLYDTLLFIWGKQNTFSLLFIDGYKKIFIKK